MSSEAPEWIVTPTLGAKVGGARYLLQRHLGEGGMGSVWLAYDLELGQHYALKFLSGAGFQDRKNWTRLRQEILRAQELRHDRIVGMFDFVVVPGEAPFLKMEYIPGRTLEQIRKDDPEGVLSWDYLQPLIPQLCSALEHAHARGIIHCDIKPSNIMVDGEQQLKLADFGIAQIADARENGPIFGTKAYMSPERLAGAQAEPSDDLYAVGATLYELLCGEPPFVGENLTSRILEEAPESLHQRRLRLGVGGTVPSRVVQHVMNCLDKDPFVRPKSAQELSRLLVPHLPVAAGPGAPVKKPPVPPEPGLGPGGKKKGPGGRPTTDGVKVSIPPRPPPSPPPDEEAETVGPVAPPPRGRPFPPFAVSSGGGEVTTPTATDQPGETGARLPAPIAFPQGFPRPEILEDPPRRGRETWLTLVVVLIVTVLLVIGAVVAAMWPKNQGFLQLRATVQGDGDASERTQFAYSVGRGGEVIDKGILDHGRLREVPLSSGEYRIDLRRLGVGTNVSGPDLEQSRTAVVTRGARVPVEFAWTNQPSGLQPSTNGLGSLELTVSDPNWKEGQSRLLFRYRVLREDQEVQSGTVPEADATTLELPAGDYRVVVGLAPESALGVTAAGENEIAQGVRIVGRAKSSLSLQFPKIVRQGEITRQDPVVDQGPPEAGKNWMRPAFRESKEGRTTARFLWLGAEGGRAWLAAEETTVGEFREFARAYSVGKGVYVPGKQGWQMQEDLSWEDPGFEQGEEHPVVGVNFHEAEAYCAWRTERDRAVGRLRNTQRYRLPRFSVEYRRAARDLPASMPGGNVAGSELVGHRAWPSAWETWRDHRDPYLFTGPVGGFPAVGPGFHDLVGNVAEWCDEWFVTTLNDPELIRASKFFSQDVVAQTERVVTGGSWFHEQPEDAHPSVASRFPPDYRLPFVGFRMAIEETETSP